MRPYRNGVWFIEGMPNGNGVRPGLAEPENWRPYKLWVGDLWVCPTCNARIIVGVGSGPVREHYQPDFADMVVSVGAELMVKDC